MSNRKRKRAHTDVRRDEILQAALPLAAAHGFQKVTRVMIADVLGIGQTTVQYHFGTMTALKSAIVRHAVKSKNLKVIAQGIVANNAHATRADPDLKKAALRSIC